MRPGDIFVAESPPRLAQAVGLRLRELVTSRLRTRERLYLALPGGSTPLLLFERLAEQRSGDPMPWHAIHVLLTDERLVPADHPGSNIGLLRKHLLDKVPIPSQNIHAVATDRSPSEAALAYHETLADLLAQSGATLDLALCGLGQDGHVASLHAGSELLTEEDDRLAAGTTMSYEGRPSLRVTLTPRAFVLSREVWVMASGEPKRRAVAASLEPRHVKTMPTDWIAPRGGRLIWLLDRAAAPELDAPQHQSDGDTGDASHR